jgi:hypothetical protein
MTFSAENLPEGLVLDASSGRITGVLAQRCEYVIKLAAENENGTARRDLKVVVGDAISLTPPMGWNSWNCMGRKVSGEQIRDKIAIRIIGKKSFVANDVAQWIDWEIDYLKYDWFPDPIRTGEMRDTLAGQKRDIHYSISNTASFKNAAVWARLTNSWRTSTDLKDSWAIGLINRGRTKAHITIKWSRLGKAGKGRVRDLWRQEDLGIFTDRFEAVVSSHGVVLVRVNFS